ncbi:MAG: SGNH/GDSL hydrolase family protein [Deltaproteobacteria bacterium]|nr:SGNH/GDSL hydrolase family protein [Deltaproteobacteria bacterium]
MRTLLWALLLAAAPGCGGTPVTTPNDAGDASPADTAPTDSAAPADTNTPADTTAPADTGPMVMRGHDSFVPMGQRPMDAARVIVLGDSISAGVGASRTALRYPNQLATNDPSTMAGMGVDLATRYGHPVTVMNLAMGGATTTTMRQNQLATLRGRLPLMGHSVVVVTIGGNDLQLAIATGQDPTARILTEAVANIRATVAFLQDRANFPDGVSVYLSNVYDPSDGEGFIENCFFNLRLPQFVRALDVWRDRFVALGRELSFSVVDALGHFHGHGHHATEMENQWYDPRDPTRWFADCIHPNDRGHHELRRLFFEAVDGTYRVP